MFLSPFKPTISNYATLAGCLSAILGVPMHIETVAILPLTNMLITQGVGLSTIVALIIGGAGASIPEASLLSTLFKKQFIIKEKLVSTKLAKEYKLFSIIQSFVSDAIYLINVFCYKTNPLIFFYPRKILLLNIWNNSIITQLKFSVEMNP